MYEQLLPYKKKKNRKKEGTDITCFLMESHTTYRFTKKSKLQSYQDSGSSCQFAGNIEIRTYLISP